MVLNINTNEHSIFLLLINMFFIIGNLDSILTCKKVTIADNENTVNVISAQNTSQEYLSTNSKYRQINRLILSNSGFSTTDVYTKLIKNVSISIKNNDTLSIFILLPLTNPAIIYNI